MEENRIVHVSLGLLGNIASLLFFLSSVPTVVQMVKLKSSGGLSGDLYVLKLFNCLMWAFYGLPFVHPNDFWVFLTNSIGCVFSCCYIIPYLIYASKLERVSLIWRLLVVLGTFISMVVLLLVLDIPQKGRITIMGVFCVVISSCMHLTLLSQCDKVIKSKDSKYLHPSSSITAFIKGAIWLAYGIVDFDMYIMIPNAIGVSIGMIQLIIVMAILFYNPQCEPEIQGQTKGEIQQEEKQSRISSSQMIFETIKTQSESNGTNTPRSSFNNASRVSSLIGLPRNLSTIVPVDDIDCSLHMDSHV